MSVEKFCDSVQILTNVQLKILFRVRRKNIKIHIPLEVRHHKHTHTVTKNIHHYHKPRKSLQDITSQDLKHEHVHHHYRDEDNQLVTLNENTFTPSSSNKKEKVVFHENFVNIENEALESLAVLQSTNLEVKATAKPNSKAHKDIYVEAASGQSSSSTKLPPVARSRTHANSRKRTATTKAASTTRTTEKSTTPDTTE